MSGNSWNLRLPQNQARTPEQMAAHLLSHRHVTDAGCWEWVGALSKTGYGKVKWRPAKPGTRGDVRVHRVAAILWLGMDIADCRLVCHRCDNPRCFNPDHLFIGTPQDNQTDCVRKGRNHNQIKTHCKHGHEYTPENTWLSMSGGRHCRSCHRKTAREHYQARRVRQ